MSQPPAPGHGQAFTFGPGPSGRRAEGPETLGIVGLVLIGLNIIVVLAVASAGTSVYLTQSSSVEFSGFVSRSPLVGLSAGRVLHVLANVAVGLVGWVVGVVATVSNRGRSYGIAAIVLGAVLLVIAANMMVAALLLKSLG